MPRSRPAPWILAGALLLLAGCARPLPREAAQPLAGLELPLRLGGGMRLEVDGEVHGRRAEVVLDVAQPLTLVSTGCFADLPRTTTFVGIPEPSGEEREAPEVTLLRARVGGRQLGSRQVGLYEEDAACVLILGTDVLAPYALEVNPARRTVRILPTRPKAEWLLEHASARAAAAGMEQHLLELTLAPKTDWPLLAVRLRQGDQTLTGTFVLSTGQAESVLGQALARRAGLRPGPDFVRELGVPPDIQLPASLGGNSYSLDLLELEPGFGVRFSAVEGQEGWKSESVVGILGGEVWGRFHAVVDPAAGVLLLSRPEVLQSKQRYRCAAPLGGHNEEACFELHQLDVEDGVQLSAAVWRELPRGGRLYLDVEDSGGNPLGGTCRLGLSFGRSERGTSAAHRVPWGGLTRALPECAEQLRTAAQVRFAFWEEEPLQACPGTCAFVQDSSNYRVSCECQGGPASAMGDAEHKFIETYRELLRRRGGPPPEDEEPEPFEP